MARGYHSGPDGGVGNITVLQNQPNAGRALELLYKIHSLVKPIMKKHGWYLPTLAEFYPKQDNLLGMNVNGGQKILIRLRPAGDPNSFYDIEGDLIGTMLHELTHNVRGPHDEIFNKQLDELEREYDALRRSGYSGEGFLSEGRRVGQGQSHNLSLAEAKALAVKRAEDRDRVAKILGKGGRLGGPRAVGDPREIRARAAERRQRMERGCGGHGEGKGELSKEVQREVDQAEKDGQVLTIRDSEDEGEVVEKALGRMSQDKDRVRAGPVASTSKLPPPPPPSKPKSTKLPDTITLSSDDEDDALTILSPPPPQPATKKRPRPASASSSSSRPSKPAPAAHPSGPIITPPKIWICAACTFRNPLSALRACQICDTPRPGPGRLTHAPAGAAGVGGGGPGPGMVEVGMGLGVVEDGSIAGRVARGEGTLDLGERGWWCDRCGRVNDHLFWTCVQCGSMKTSSERG